LVRIVTVSVLAILLCGRCGCGTRTGTSRRPIAVLIDASLSMNSADPRPDFDDRWRAAVAFDKLRPTRLPTRRSPR